MWRIAVLATVLAGLTGGTQAQEARGIKDAELVLHVVAARTFEQMPEAAPPRFVLLEDGRFFLGGSEAIAGGKLDGKEHKNLRKQIGALLKRGDLPGTVALGSGETQYRLTFRRGATLTAVGNPDEAPYGLARDVARLVLTLLELDHVTLRPIEPDRLMLMVRRGELRGGCRTWTLPVPLIDALPAPRIIDASAAAGWPRGAHAASVCAEGKTYVVGLRPLLPVEQN